MTYRVRDAGDAALVLEFEARIDPTINARAIAVAGAIRAGGYQGVHDVVASYRSVTVCFDPLHTDVERLAVDLERFARGVDPDARVSGSPIIVPVCYGGAHGPDLEEVATSARCLPEDVIRLHAAPVYRVYMVGFMPGFAYMGVVDSRIAVPRRATPRLRVPVGAVAIAGAQTGIYPMETPGGWQLIGRTPLRPFDPQRADPFLFKPGDAVRFEPISEAVFRDRAPSGEPGRTD